MTATKLLLRGSSVTPTEHLRTVTYISESIYGKYILDTQIWTEKCVLFSLVNQIRKKKQKDLNYKSCACLRNRNGAFVSVCACNLCVSDDFRIKKLIFVYPKIELFNTIRCFFFRFHINYTLTYIRKYAYIHRFFRCDIFFQRNQL